jgi:AcrR family transcriptional regulator
MSMNIADRKEREKQERRTEILSAAKRTFFKHGFERSSMDMVAQEAALAKGTLYLYFKSKEELYLSLVSEGIDIFDAMMDKVTLGDLPIERRLVEMSKTYCRFAHEHNDYFKIFMMMDIGALREKVEPEKLDAVHQHRDKTFVRMQNVIQVAIDEKIFPDTLQPKEILLMLWATTWGAVMMASEKCKQLEMFSEADADKFVTQIAERLVWSFKQDLNLGSFLKPSPKKSSGVKTKSGKTVPV